MSSINKKILRLLYVPLIAFTIVPMGVSATSFSLEQKDKRQLSQEAIARFNDIISRPEFTWGRVLDVSVEKLEDADTLSCSLYNEQVELYIKYRREYMGYTYAHYVSSDYECHAYISILDNNIHGDIRSSIGTFQILPMSETEAAIVRYETDIPLEPEYDEIVDNSNIENSHRDVESIRPSSTPTIRVLFLYTPSALTMMNSPYQQYMKMEAYRYINEGNESFANSNINAHLELAYLGQVDYNESSHTWSESLNLFSSQNDGYMDEVHTLREKYAADICVLMINKSTLCGEVKAINATNNTAFCIIWPSFSYCGWRYSAIHEIGHLIGCRHNKEQDSSNSPYNYGHGFMNCVTDGTSPSWCTIMSYESTCADPSCYRILHWSNPDTIYNGIATGTPLADNAKVWRSRAYVVSEFRGMDSNITLTSNDNNADALFESYEASSIISIGEGYEVQAGQTVDMVAADQITLNPGTYIKSGANFRASIRSNFDTSNYPQFIKGKYSNVKETFINRPLIIAPNPVTLNLHIQIADEITKVKIYNINGQCVLQSSQTDIDVSDLPQGMYILRALTADGLQHQAKFIKE